MKERRIKIIYVSSNQILYMFGEHRFIKDNDTWTVVSWKIKDLPKDHEVISVNYDTSFAAWTFGIYSKEFPIVPMGDQIPVIKMETVELIKEEGIYVKKEPYKPMF